MAKMLTLFGKDIRELKYNELKRERRVQSLLLTRIRKASREFAGLREKSYKRDGCLEGRDDKIQFFELYVQHIEALIEEIDFWLDRRLEPESSRDRYRSKEKMRAENARRRQNYLNDNFKSWAQAKSEDGLYVSWDKDKFDLIAADRGYQTEEAVLSAVASELRLTRTKARLAINSGRFTWGQVLCLGAMLDMTPKEFCDTFLSGYFTEQWGEYRASYENLDKTALLRRAEKSKPIEPEPKPEPPPVVLPEPDYIETDSSGKPIDEEIWFE